MSMNTTFDSWVEMMEHLQQVDDPQCFTVNYLPETESYEIWIGNQPYYHYDKLIELEEKDNEKLMQRIKALNREKEMMYKLALKQDWKESDWSRFERLFSK